MKYEEKKTAKTLPILLIIAWGRKIPETTSPINEPRNTPGRLLVPSRSIIASAKPLCGQKKDIELS